MDLQLDHRGAPVAGSAGGVVNQIMQGTGLHGH
jgi:hypothetical protein